MKLSQPGETREWPGELIVLKLQNLELSEVIKGLREIAFEILVSELNSGDPVVFGAFDIVPVAWIGVRPVE